MYQTRILKFEDGKVSKNIIKFSQNLNNKLNCNFFTTIRRPELFTFYDIRKGEVFDVFLNNTFLFKAFLLDVIFTSLDRITPELLVLDTGTTNYKKIFDKFHIYNKCIILLFERLR